MKHEIRSASIQASGLQLRSRNGKKHLSGYAIRFGQPADLGDFVEYVAPSAINLKRDKDVLLLRDHKQELLLGRTGVNLSLTVDSRGLKFDCDLLGTTTANDAHADIEAGLLSGCSFGFFVREDAWEQKNGKIIRTLTDVQLFEISATSFPAYNSTNVDARAIRSKLSKSPVPANVDNADNLSVADRARLLSLLVRRG